MRAVRVRLAALSALALLSGCGGGCGNCSVPPYTAVNVPGVTPGPGTTPTPAPTPTKPGATPSPTPTRPGATPTPAPTATPIATPFPTPTPIPPIPTPTPTPPLTPLTCAQNAIVGQGVPLGSDASFAVLAGSTVTNVGLTTVTGNLGVSPGNAITGFGPGQGTVTGGAIHAGDPVAATAQLDLTTAYNNAAGRAALGVAADLGGLTLAPGVYRPAAAGLGITGTVTLDGLGNPNSVFIFQMASTLTTSVGSTVALINGAQACNVFWQVGSSATINATSNFNGTILALASISLGTGTILNGRTLARTAAVTLLQNTVTVTGP